MNTELDQTTKNKLSELVKILEEQYSHKWDDEKYEDHYRFHTDHGRSLKGFNDGQVQGSSMNSGMVLDYLETIFGREFIENLRK